jgi:sugar lactone lactonase YvrE
MFRFWRVAAGAAAALALVPAFAAARPGDLYVTDSGPDAGADVFRVDPASGAPTPVFSTATDDQPAALAFAPDGRLLLVDRDFPGAPEFNGTLFGIDLNSGAGFQITGGAPFESPTALDVEPGGTALVADADAPAGEGLGGLFRVDLETGVRAPLSFSPLYFDPRGVAVAPTGEIYLADNRSGGPPLFPGAVFRVDPASGAATAILTGTKPSSLVLRPDGKLLVLMSTGTAPGIFLLDPATGLASPITSGPPLTSPQGIAVAPDGSIYVADPSAYAAQGAIFRVDPGTGAITPIKVGAPLDSPEGIAVAPPTCRGKPATIVGSDGTDRLVGSRFADVIAGLGAKDRIKGGAGKDRICGGTGRDRISGGSGRDRCSGGKGADTGKSCERGKL